MKIGILVRDLVQEGGGERQLLELAVRLQRRGHQVNVYTCVYNPTQCYPDLSRQLNIVAMGPNWLRRLPRPFFALDFLLQWLEMRLLAKHIPDDLDLLNPHPYLAYAAACQVKKRSGTPVVYHSNDVYLLPHQSHWMSENRNVWLARLSTLARRPWMMYERSCYRLMDRILVSARWLAESLKEFYGVEARVIPSGVDTLQFKPGPRDVDLRQRYGVGADDILLFSMNSLLPHRRYEDTLDAVALLRKEGVPVKLWIGGKAPHEPYSEFLKAKVRHLGLESYVRFLGNLPENDLRRYYLACDIYVFAAEWESWSLSVTEAMACQKPVLLSQTSGNDEFFVDGRDVLQFRPRHPEELAEKVRTLIQDPACAHRIAETGCRLIYEQYTWDHYVDAVLKEFERILNPMKRFSTVDTKRPKEAVAS